MLSDLGALAAIVLAVLVGAIYLLPSLIAFNRGVERRWMILFINVFLGGSVIFWLIALYLATRKVKTTEQAPEQAPAAQPAA
ncbi:superinfection immunity protein [Streptomyces alboniger]|uniref:Superinfection immunity protein n=1 Tax=Streptomyces alboniger TaxID=132473 RepID=A0A5J6HEZ8_STRAD|nr:superinfection immunity protein [Streptomyces alboniger]QEV18118.1 superinfection immunity protein [Streptomyces alboniger]